MNNLSDKYINDCLERVLRVAGSSLRHYMPGSKEELRRTMRQLLEEDRAAKDAGQSEAGHG